MAFQLRRSDDQGVPWGAIRSPDDDRFYVAVLDRINDSVYGSAIQEADGDVEAWFPYGGEEIHEKGDDFSFLVKDPAYSYTWILVHKYLKNRDRYHVLSANNGDDIVPASFAGRIGKINLSSMYGWTGFGGQENTRGEDEVDQAKILCVRRKHEECHLDYPLSHVDYHESREGAYPPADSVRANDCKYRSYVVLSTDYDPPQFGRASLNMYRDGLQAWFPYGGNEDSKDSFHLLRSRDGQACLYWAPISDVHHHADQHEVVKYGGQSPAVMRGVLGKAIVDELRGWISFSGEEHAVDQDDVLNGLVLCYRDHD